MLISRRHNVVVVVSPYVKIDSIAHTRYFTNAHHNRCLQRLMSSTFSYGSFVSRLCEFVDEKERERERKISGRIKKYIYIYEPLENKIILIIGRRAI